MEQSTGQMVSMIVMTVVMVLALYFFIIRPQSKQKKEEEAMRGSLEIGDEIITIGGIVGRVVNINDDAETMIIETGADRTKIKMKKWALSSVVTEKTKPAPKKEKDEKKK